jgi:putative intracellular protease/amidase
LFVLPPKYYAENARMFPDQFRNAGYTVKMASSYSSVIEVCTSSFDDSISELAYQVDLIFKEVNVSDYDATIYIGGYGCQDQWTDKASLRIAQAAIEQGKVLGATGCGATILAYAGLLQGKQAVVCSGNPPVKNGKDYCKILESLGAICSQEVIVREGLIVTAKQRSPDFVAAIIEVINESH